MRRMEHRKKLVILGRPPTKEIWGVVDSLVEENARALEMNDMDFVLGKGVDKLLAWQNTAADRKGPFMDWSFKLGVQ